MCHTHTTQAKCQRTLSAVVRALCRALNTLDSLQGRKELGKSYNIDHERQLVQLFETVEPVRAKLMALLQTIEAHDTIQLEAVAVKNLFSRSRYAGGVEGHAGVAEAMP